VTSVSAACHKMCVVLVKLFIVRSRAYCVYMFHPIRLADSATSLHEEMLALETPRTLLDRCLTDIEEG
jgi:hypothetical protein